MIEKTFTAYIEPEKDVDEVKVEVTVLADYETHREGVSIENMDIVGVYDIDNDRFFSFDDLPKHSQDKLSKQAQWELEDYATNYVQDLEDIEADRYYDSRD